MEVRVSARCTRWIAGWTLALAAAGVAAGPAEDYQRGLLAYQRGDVAAAMAALKPPAASGHAPSQALLAFILDRADFTDEAVRLYLLAAVQDDPEAIAALGGLYLTGRGVAKDEKRGWAHFSKAAELGHEKAIQAVADRYLKQWPAASGPDEAEAQKALRRAAEKGYLPAVDALAKAYVNGGLGLQADATQAQQWQSRAAELRRQRGLPIPKART